MNSFKCYEDFNKIMDETGSQVQNVNKKQCVNTQKNEKPYEQNAESFLMKNPHWVKEEYLIEKELIEILKTEESFDAYLKSININ